MFGVHGCGRGVSGWSRAAARCATPLWFGRGWRGGGVRCALRVLRGAVVSVAVALAAVLVLAAGVDAGAQGVVPVLVSNADQAVEDSGLVTGAGRVSYAQPFRTGDFVDGYVLSSVEVGLGVGSGVSVEVRLMRSVWVSDGPGEPFSFRPLEGSGVVLSPVSALDDDDSTLETFGAVDVRLEPATAYWISVTKTAGADDGLSVAATLALDGVDAGGAAGWSMGDTAWAFESVDGSGEWSESGGPAGLSLRIRLRGSEAVRPELGPYVSNRHLGFRAGVVKTSSSVPKYAAPFRTGSSSGGIELASVVLGVAAESGTVPRAAIHLDSSGSPAAAAVTGGTLSAPASVSADLDAPGRAVFTAADPVGLDASTTYWVVLDVGSGSGQVSVSTTTKSGTAGSLGFDDEPPAIDRPLKSFGGSSWSVDGDSRLLRMAVGGPTDHYPTKVRVGVPQVGVAVAAEVADFAGRVRNVSFQWQRGPTDTGPFADIPADEGGTAAAYTPVLGDLGMWLNATATYDNAFSTAKTAAGVSFGAVLSRPAVSNVGLISDVRFIVDGPTMSKLAQPFTTGPGSAFLLRGVRVGIGVDIGIMSWALHADDTTSGASRPAPEPLFDPVEISCDVVHYNDVSTTIIELSHPGIVLAPDTRYWLVISNAHPNPVGFSTRSLSGWGDQLLITDGRSPLGPGSEPGWTIDYNALTHDNTDPDNPRWIPHTEAVELSGRTALQMSILVEPALAPTPPHRLEASPGDARAGLFWGPPASEGASPITHYEYRYKAGTSSYGEWAQVPDADNDGDLADERKLVVTGLTNDTEHIFEVRAVNSETNGNGPPARTKPLTPAVGIPTLTVTAGAAKATGGIDWLGYTFTRSGSTTEAYVGRYRLVGPEGNDWGSINTFEDLIEFASGIDAVWALFSLDDQFENSYGFSGSATMGGTLEIQLFGVGYDSIDASAPVEVVVVEDPAWVVSFGESSYSFEEGSGTGTVTMLVTATSTDMPAPAAAYTRSVIGFRTVSGDGTAVSGGDFAAVSAMLNPVPGVFALNADGFMEGSVKVDLTLLDDSVVESDEQLVLYLEDDVGFLQNVHGATSVGWLAFRGADGVVGAGGLSRSVPVTILDDDVAVLSVSVSSVPSLPVDSMSKDTYGRGAWIVFAVEFSAPVDVSGVPVLSFTLGTEQKQAAFSGGSGTGTLLFSYRVQLADADTDGVSWAADGLALSGGSISRAGTSGAAVLSHALEGALSGHKVDGSMVAVTAPGFAAAAAERSVAENAVSGAVGAAVAAVDADGDVVWHSVAAVDASDAAVAALAAFGRDFVVDAASGQVTVRPGALLDFEARPSYVVLIEATDREDAAGLAESAPYTVDDTVTLTITVDNVDEAGTVAVSGSPTAGQTLTAALSDPDGSVSVTGWAWSRSSSASSGFADIAGAASASYEVQDADEGMYLRATAAYGDGHGAGKSASGVTADPAAVNAPANLAAVPGDGRVALSWDDPGDSAIDRYQYRYRRASDAGWNPDWTDVAASHSATVSLTVRDLANGVGYVFGVRRVYLDGGSDDPGAHSEVGSVPRGPLGAPAGFGAVAAGDGEIALSWDDPGDVTITGYEYRHRPVSDAAWDPDWTGIPAGDAATVSHTLSGLANNVRYAVEVRAVRDGTGGPAARGAVTPRGPLRAPAGFAAQPGDTRVALSWDRTDDDSVTGYEYRHRPGSDAAWNPDWTDVPGSDWSTTAFTVGGLANRVGYVFEVSAVRGTLRGPASSVRATPQGPPTVPPALAPAQIFVDRTSDGHAVIWIPFGNEDPRAPVTGYRVRWRQTGTGPWTQARRAVDDVTRTQHIDALENRVHYQVQIAAANRVGTGAWATVVYTPQQPWGEALDEVEPDPDDDDDLSISGLFAYWTAGYGTIAVHPHASGTHPDASAGRLTLDPCTGTHSFRVFWDVPDGDPVPDRWQAHIITRRGAGIITHEFRTADSGPEMIGNVSIAGPAALTIRIRATYGTTHSTWSPGVHLNCTQTP